MTGVFITLLNKKTNSANIKTKINNLGNKILKNTFKEIDLFIVKK